MPSKLGIVIPCFEELAVINLYLPKIFNRIGDRSATELIIADAFEDSARRDFVENNQAKYSFVGKAQRSLQLNHGANLLTTDALLFLHIDSLPPKGFDTLILSKLNSDCQAGAFHLSFYPAHPFLNFFAWFTRFKAMRTRGDQGLFLKRTLFDKLDGYREDYAIMADVELSTRLIKQSSFKILPQKITTSSRKYQEVGMVKLQLVFGLLTVMHWFGFSNKKIYRTYQYFVKPAHSAQSL